MKDSLTEALTDRVKVGIERDNWQAVLVGSGRAVPLDVQDWLEEVCGFDDIANAVIAVFDKSLELPPSVDAVDPQVADPGTPAPREKGC